MLLGLLIIYKHKLVSCSPLFFWLRTTEEIRGMRPLKGLRELESKIMSVWLNCIGAVGQYEMFL